MKPTRRLHRSTRPSKAHEAPDDRISGTRRVVSPAPPPAVETPGPDRRPTVRLGRVKQPDAPMPSERRTEPPSATEPAPVDLPPAPPPRVRHSVSLLTQASFDAVPMVTITAAQLMTRKLDPRKAFVLGLIDGRTSIESLLDACPLSTHEVLRILGDLLRDGVIALR
jgi:hypothetical protein